MGLINTNPGGYVNAGGQRISTRHFAGAGGAPAVRSGGGYSGVTGFPSGTINVQGRSINTNNVLGVGGGGGVVRNGSGYSGISGARTPMATSRNPMWGRPAGSSGTTIGGASRLSGGTAFGRPMRPASSGMVWRNGGGFASGPRFSTATPRPASGGGSPIPPSYWSRLTPAGRQQFAARNPNLYMRRS